MIRPSTNKIKMLLVEDSPLHQKLTRRALQATDLDVDLDVASDGVEALAYLNGCSADTAGHAQPDVILLDLNMPRMSGLEVLNRIKTNPALRSIPIAVLTTSEAPNDIRTSYEAGANTYLTKPNGFHEFRDMLQSFGEFWLKRARLPRHGA